VACSLATSLATGAVLLLGDRRDASGLTYLKLSSGPYALVFSMYSLYSSLVPATRPRLVGFLGLDVSDKALVYLAGAQLLFSSGLRSVVPGACGLVAGAAYLSDALKLYSLALPKSLDRWLFRPPHVGAAAPRGPSSSRHRGAGPGRGAPSGVGRDFDADDDDDRALGGARGPPGFLAAERDDDFLRGGHRGLGIPESAPPAPPVEPRELLNANRIVVSCRLVQLKSFP